MGTPITVFSLADVMAKSDAAKMNRRQMQMMDLKMQEYQRNQEQQQTLGDIFAGSIETTGATPEVPAQPYVEQNSPESAFGLPELQGNTASEPIPANPGRTDLNFNSAFKRAQALPEAMRGPVLMQLHQARQAEEDRRMLMMSKMKEIKGEQYEGQLQYGKDGKVYRIRKGGLTLDEASTSSGVSLDPGFIPVTETDPVTMEQVIRYRPRKGGDQPSSSLGPDANKEKDSVLKDYQDKRMPELDDYVTRLHLRFQKSPEMAPGIAGKNPLARFASSAEGQQFVSDLQALVGTSIAKNAGLSQTESEAKRVMNMFAASDLHTVGELRYAFERFKKTYATERRVLYAKSPRAAKYLKDTINVDLEKAPWEQPKQPSIPQNSNNNSDFAARMKAAGVPGY